MRKRLLRRVLLLLAPVVWRRVRRRMNRGRHGGYIHWSGRGGRGRYGNRGQSRFWL